MYNMLKSQAMTILISVALSVATIAALNRIDATSDLIRGGNKFFG